ncbi:MAG: hypothetical protein EHM20_18190, partial [Alphaproteobacteria bacterium]
MGMKFIHHIISPELIEARGWTLIHSLWQGTVLALVLVLLLLLIHRNSAQLKYFISFITLACLMGWSVITFVNSYAYASEKAKIKENITSTPGYIQSYLKQTISETKVIEMTGKKSINLQILKIRGFFQRNFTIICFLWVVGIVFFSLRLVGGFIYLRRIRTTNLIGFNDEWVDKLQ